MAHDIGIWAIDPSQATAQPLRPADRLETEELLEDLLVANPRMLMPDLWLVGRQTPTESGIADLLGVAEDGRLVVFELKRGKLTRDAVAQAVDYCSYLESFTEEELAAYIARHSGTNGIDEIDDFETQYSDRRGEELASLRPVRMVLVGVGADNAARRMVDFLASREVDISLLTFHGWQDGTNTLLARQVENVEVRDAGLRSRRTQAEHRRQLDEQAGTLGIGGLWRDAVEALSVPPKSYRTSRGLTFYYPRKIALPDNVRVGVSHSVRMDDDGTVRITFYPVAVDLCLETFREAPDAVSFRKRPPPNAPPTERVSDEWYCNVDEERWKAHKDTLIELARAVDNAWHTAA